MKDERPIKPNDFISIAEYAFFVMKKNDLPMAVAEVMKAKAFNVPNKKLREKRNIKTPLLQLAAWDKIWNEHYNDRDEKQF